MLHTSHPGHPHSLQCKPGIEFRLSNMLKYLFFLCFSEIGKFNSKLNFYKLIPYLVDRCICLAPCQSRQTLEKTSLAGLWPGPVVSCSFARWLCSLPAGVLCMHACAFPLFVVYLRKSPFLLRIAGKVGWESPCPLDKVLTYKNVIYY